MVAINGVKEKDYSHPNLYYSVEGEFVFYRVGKERKTYCLTKEQAQQYWLTEKDNSPKNGCLDTAGWTKYLKSLQERAFNVCETRPGIVVNV